MRRLPGHVHTDLKETAQPNIALASGDGFYIYRGLKESFRLKVPNLDPDPEEQLLWSQYEGQPEKLADELKKLSGTRRLTESAKYLIGANTFERKQQLVKRAFTEGITEKDAVCAIAVIKPLGQDAAVGNVVLLTQLKFMHILDNFGHRILSTVNIDIVTHEAYAFGMYPQKYTVICVGRSNSVLIIENDRQRSFNFQKRTISSVLDYPNLFLLTNNQTINCYNLSADSTNKKTSMIRVQGEPIQLELMKLKNSKALLVALKTQVRIYNHNVLIYRLAVSDPIVRIKFGTYGRQDGCLILFYQARGFQVKIVHRLFNPAVKVEKEAAEVALSDSLIPIPKKTVIFQSECQAEKELATDMYRGYMRDMRMLKWRLLKEEANESRAVGLGKKIKLQSTIVGMGPRYILRLQMENISQEAIYEVDVTANYDQRILEVDERGCHLPMMIPNFTYPTTIPIFNKSNPSQQSSVKLIVSHGSGQKSTLAVIVPAGEPPQQ